MVRIISLLSILTFFLTVCTSDETSFVNSDNIVSSKSEMEKTEATVNFSLSMPSILETRAGELSEYEENKIEYITLLQFENINGREYLRHKCNVNNIQDGARDSIKHFSARLRTGAYNIVAIANARHLTDSITFADYDSLKSVVLNSLVDTNYGKWPRKALPSWSESGVVKVDTMTSLTLKMMRMVAKVDLNFLGNAAGKFKLENIRLYNYSTRGTIVPQSSKLPTEPSGGYGKMDYPNRAPLLYETSDGLKPNGSNRVIYILEAPEGNPATRDSNICLVVGGKYNNSPTTTYYRLDFASHDKSNGQDTWHPIVRNHRYVFNITDVTNDGKATPELAFKGAPANLVANLQAWDESAINEFVWDNNNILGVSTRVLELSRRIYDAQTPSDTNRLSIKTDIPTGWTVDKIIDAATQQTPTWFTLSQTSGLANKLEHIYIYTTNVATTPRSGYIDLKAGALTSRITVKQTPARTKPLTISLKIQYAIDGAKKYFSVEGEREWEIIDVTGNSLNLLDGGINSLKGKRGGQSGILKKDSVEFTLKDYRLDSSLKAGTIKLVFQDETGDKYYKDLNGGLPFLIGTFGFEVWPEDQNPGCTWYEYMGKIDASTTDQLRPNSCTMYHGGNVNQVPDKTAPYPYGRRWRLPTIDEMKQMLEWSKLYPDSAEILMLNNVDYGGPNINSDNSNIKNIYWTSSIINTYDTRVAAYYIGNGSNGFVNTSFYVHKNINASQYTKGKLFARCVRRP
ncbi:MAG: hypothetical protein LBH04_10120 [Tannerellaceae bacterium]|jgi:hypothetical protein|nr:hypothetical protein [Tannerellaceae bacterium]